MVIWGLAKTAVVPLSIRSFEYYVTVVLSPVLCFVFCINFGSTENLILGDCQLTSSPKRWPLLPDPNSQISHQSMFGYTLYRVIDQPLNVTDWQEYIIIKDLFSFRWGRVYTIVGIHISQRNHLTKNGWTKRF